MCVVTFNTTQISHNIPTFLFINVINLIAYNKSTIYA